MKRIYKISAIVIAFALLSFGTFTTWGLMSAIVSNQETIVAQQNMILSQQNELLDLLEETFEQLTTKPMSQEVEFEVHVDMWHYRNGVLLAYSHHQGTLTTIGKNWIEQKLGADTDSTNGTYIALSNSTSTPGAGWTDLPEEITTGNMSRAEGTYVNVGDGVWNVTYTFNPSESNSTRLVGLLWDTGASKLLAADTITPINYQDPDTVMITWQITVS